MSIPDDAQATVLPFGRDQVGESPWWDAARETLWRVDTFAPAVIGQGIGESRYPTPEMAGGVALASDGRLVAALQTGLFVATPGADAAWTFHSAPRELPETHRFNDLTTDAAGRLLVGSMRLSQLGATEPTGTLYAYTAGVWRTLVTGLYTINGLAVSPDGSRLYWSDSHPDVQRIFCADYDTATGAIGAPAEFADMTGLPGRPDGAAVDREGGYWIAAIGGGCLHRFGPDGALTHTLPLPVEHPTKIAFGGIGLERMFVTSLSIRPSATDPECAGAVIAVTAPVAGHALASVQL